MTHKKPIQSIRNFIDNGLRIKMTPGNPEDIRAAAFAFQNALYQMKDETIQFLIDNPIANLRIQKLKPKPSNVLHQNANTKTHTRQRNS